MPARAVPTTAASPPQTIRFCRSADGVRIAYAVHGSGPPLVIATCWLSHLQFDWQSPVWRHFLAELGEFATIIRYDERGHGLSDWDVEDHSLQARVGDLEAVVEAAGYDRFALMAHVPGWSGLHRVCRGPSRAGHPAALLRQLRRRDDAASPEDRELTRPTSR